MRRLILAIAVAAVAAVACQPIVVDHETSPCVCASEDEVCVNGLCTLVASECTPSSGCSDPYACDDFDRGRCACNPTRRTWPECAPRCAELGDCPAGQSCDLARGICEYPLQCLSDAACSEGQVCRPFGSLPDLVWDGNTGYTISSRLGRVCTSESDDAETGCAGASDCGMLDECTLGSDCGDTDCAFIVAGTTVCEGGPRCGPDEFRIEFTFPECWRQEACRYDEECSEGYTCRMIGAESSGYCGRPA